MRRFPGIVCVHRDMLALVDLSKQRHDIKGEKLLPEPQLRIQLITRDTEETTDAYCIDGQGKLHLLCLRVE